jgi:hypothetical protein
MEQSYQTTKQLFWMKNVLLNQGVSCVYLSANAKQSRYCMHLMAWLFRFDYFSIEQYVIQYPKPAGTLYFKHTTNPPHTLQGYKASIIADHRAFEGINNGEYQEFFDLIKHSKKYEHP